MPNATTLDGWVEWDQQREVERWELANGQLVQRMTRNGERQAIVANLLDLIRPAARGHGCVAVPDPYVDCHRLPAHVA